MCLPPFEGPPYLETWKEAAPMTEGEYASKLDELDRLLNDPDVPMEPSKVWSLLAEIAQRDLASGCVPSD
jgi:hypothetical protein